MVAEVEVFCRERTQNAQRGDLGHERRLEIVKGSKKYSTASLIIFTGEKDPNLVSKRLGVRPTKTVTDANAAKNKIIVRSRLSESRELSDHIEAVLTILESREAEFQLLKKEIGKIVIFCKFSSQYGQGSMDVKSELLQRLAKNQVDLVIDLYPPTED